MTACDWRLHSQCFLLWHSVSAEGHEGQRSPPPPPFFSYLPPIRVWKRWKDLTDLWTQIAQNKNKKARNKQSCGNDIKEQSTFTRHHFRLPFAVCEAQVGWGHVHFVCV
ncbi:MAG: hypothetical protein BYD32DRAFT_424468 [Podila humilis]|nr:MAG: hypothetical protein BYD32DRAFT_424468 [Podila humilis]